MSKKVWIINHYIQTPHNGTLIRHYSFAPYLKERGYDATLFTSSAIHNSTENVITGNEPYKRCDVDGRDFVYVKTSSYSGNGLSRIKNMFQFYFRVRKVAKKIAKTEGKPDIIYSSSPQPLSLRAALLLAKKFNVPCVCEVRDLWPESIVQYKGTSAKNPLIKILYKLEKWIYTRADALVFTMCGVENYIKRQGWDNKVDLNKMFHVNNGVELKLFEQNAKECVYPDDVLDSDGLFKIVYCGSVRLANNVKLLVDAVAEMKKRGCDNARLLVFGDGNEREPLIQYCKDNGIDNVFFRGFVDKKYIPSIVRRADVNAICFRKVGLTDESGCSFNKMFDYFASGKPVFSNVWVRDNLILEYDCGMVTKTQETDEQVELLTQLYNMTDEQRKRMGENSYKAAQAHDYPILTDKLIEAFNYAEQHHKK